MELTTSQKSAFISEMLSSESGINELIRILRPLQNSSYNLSFLNIFIPLWYETEVILSQFC